MGGLKNELYKVSSKQFTPNTISSRRYELHLKIFKNVQILILGPLSNALLSMGQYGEITTKTGRRNERVPQYLPPEIIPFLARYVDFEEVNKLNNATNYIDDPNMLLHSLEVKFCDLLKDPSFLLVYRSLNFLSIVMCAECYDIYCKRNKNSASSQFICSFPQNIIRFECDSSIFLPAIVEHLNKNPNGSVLSIKLREKNEYGLLESFCGIEFNLAEKLLSTPSLERLEIHSSVFWRALLTDPENLDICENGAERIVNRILHTMDISIPPSPSLIDKLFLFLDRYTFVNLKILRVDAQYTGFISIKNLRLLSKTLPTLKMLQLSRYNIQLLCEGISKSKICSELPIEELKLVDCYFPQILVESSNNSNPGDCITKVLMFICLSIFPNLKMLEVKRSLTRDSFFSQENSKVHMEPKSPCSINISSLKIWNVIPPCVDLNFLSNLKNTLTVLHLSVGVAYRSQIDIWNTIANSVKNLETLHLEFTIAPLNILLGMPVLDSSNYTTFSGITSRLNILELHAGSKINLKQEYLKYLTQLKNLTKLSLTKALWNMMILVVSCHPNLHKIVFKHVFRPIIQNMLYLPRDISLLSLKHFEISPVATICPTVIIQFIENALISSRNLGSLIVDHPWRHANLRLKKRCSYKCDSISDFKFFERLSVLCPNLKTIIITLMSVSCDGFLFITERIWKNTLRKLTLSVQECDNKTIDDLTASYKKLSTINILLMKNLTETDLKLIHSSVKTVRGLLNVRVWPHNLIYQYFEEVSGNSDD